MVPDMMGIGENAGAPSSGALVCVRAAPRYGDASATTLAAGFSGIAATSCGLAVYPDADAGTALASGSAPCTTRGIVRITGLSYTLDAGTTYRWCLCAPGSQNYLGAVALTGRMTALLRAFTSSVVATGNLCTAGVPPTTTGPLTGVSTLGAPVFWSE